MNGPRPADSTAVAMRMAVSVVMAVIMPFMGLMAMPVMMPVRLQGG